jgi:hypothetical protein
MSQGNYADDPPADAEANGQLTSVEPHPDAPIDEAQLHTLEEDEMGSDPTPRFLQDAGAWKRWKWVPYPVRRFLIAAAQWSKGPASPRDFKIAPVFPAVQHAPLWLLDKYLPKRQHRLGLLAGYIGIWVLTFALVMKQGTFATEIEDWGKPSEIGCGNSYWGSGNRCGLGGNDCRPFNGSGFAFKCPANCANYQVLNPRAVGDQEIIYQPLVIGGPPGESDDKAVYRGDSHICGSAIHAGLISNTNGGCGVVKLTGQHSRYANSTRHGISSVGFDSYFPLSFMFSAGVECESRDPRWALLAVSVVFTTVLSLFTASPALFFFTMFTALFWHVGLASDPPWHSSIPDLISNILGKYLPAMFCAWVIYDKMGARRTLFGLTAQIEKTVLWLGACWVGALDNYTFQWIPIQRLTPHDLAQQPGAWLALASIIVVLAVIVVQQVWYFRQEGRLLKYLKLYGLFVLGILACLAAPDLNLRIHHYILALLLLPGTSMQTRPALLYQGLLVGLFINGIARWGFDSVLQTSYALQGDAVHQSPLPTILAPAIVLGANVSSITFRWAEPPHPRYDGISVLVNDVERFRGYVDERRGEGWEGKGDRFVWTRKGDAGYNEYFRFGYMEGSQSWDYTRAGVWTKEGEWVEMAPGPSKVKRREIELEGEESVRVRDIGEIFLD